MTVSVTHHAIARYIERVAPVDPAVAYAEIIAAERGIETAAAFGGRIVRLANGARLVVRGGGPRAPVGRDGRATNSPIRVVTVLGRSMIDGGRYERLARAGGVQ